MVAIVGSAAVVMSEKLGCEVSGGEVAAAEVEVASCVMEVVEQESTHRGWGECRRCCKTGCPNHVTTGSSFLGSQ